MALLRRRAAARVEDSPAASPHEPCTDIADAVPRRPMRIRGQVVRMRARPTSGVPALAVTISDATGSVTAVWTGRRAIGGISLGRRLIIEGVGCRVGERLEFTNPTYTLLAD